MFVTTKTLRCLIRRVQSSQLTPREMSGDGEVFVSTCINATAKLKRGNNGDIVIRLISGDEEID